MVSDKNQNKKAGEEDTDTEEGSDSEENSESEEHRRSRSGSRSSGEGQRKERQREKALGGGLRTVWRLYVHLYSVYYTKNLNISENWYADIEF